jgi:hypothetical protein
MPSGLSMFHLAVLLHPINLVIKKLLILSRTQKALQFFVSCCESNTSKVLGALVTCKNTV